MTMAVVVVAVVMRLMVGTLIITLGIFTEANSVQRTHNIYQLLTPIGYKVATATTYSSLRELLISKAIYLKQITHILVDISKSLRH